MYESDEQRDAEIDELAAADPADLRDRLLAATTEFDDAVAAVDDDRWGGVVHRTPGGPGWPAVTIVATRRREVEIHHADLGASYTRHDWPDDFVAELLDVVSVDQADAGPFQLRATDLGRDWAVGGDGGPDGDRAAAPTSAGGSPVAAPGDGLSCDAGTLPGSAPWRRATSRRVPGSPLNGPTTLLGHPAAVEARRAAGRTTSPSTQAALDLARHHRDRAGDRLEARRRLAGRSMPHAAATVSPDDQVEARRRALPLTPARVVGAVRATSGVEGLARAGSTSAGGWSRAPASRASYAR